MKFIIGNKYKVLCIKIRNIVNADWEYEEGELVLKDTEYVPVYDNLHNDKSTGQKEYHYHIDSRFTKVFSEGTRFTVDPKKAEIFYKEFECIREEEIYSTRLGSEFKYCKRMKNNKCPHKGFDLSNVQPDGRGHITCPLHGLRFYKSTGERVIKNLG